jgi:EGF domain-specific O-GlcNAc transferase
VFLDNAPTIDLLNNITLFLAILISFATSTAQNFFHDSEDFTNAFLAMAILEWSLDDTQVYLTDLFPQGPFWSIWEEAFSNGHHGTTLTSWDLKLKFGRSGNDYRVCFKKLAVGIYGPASPITVNSWNTPCRHTALVRAYSDFIIRGLGLHELTHYAQPKPNATVVVTFLARRASSEWPEKRFCNDETSFFLCKYWAHMGIRSLGRMIRNEKDVIAVLRQQLTNRNFENGVAVIFQDVDYNLLTLKEQIAVDLQTDILVGPHGAGLMHNIFMRDRASLVELFIDGSGANRHFHNLASWYGRNYVSVAPSNPMNPMELISILEHIILTTDWGRY